MRQDERVLDYLDQCRLRIGEMASTDSDGMAGAFVLGSLLRVISSGPAGWRGNGPWEHVSVSLEHRIPSWNEMNFVKAVFWGEEECVVQFHPPKSKYVNVHPNCLHLWKPPYHFELPPKELIG